jgi:hypothetical protein
VAYRLPGSRQQLDLDGPSVEIEPCHSWALQQLGIGLAQAFFDAKDAQAEFSALQALGRFVLAEAMPTWDILDHHGPVPPTESGWLRLPNDLKLEITVEWLKTANPKASAVDELIPPGEAREEIKRRLRKVA